MVGWTKLSKGGYVKTAGRDSWRRTSHEFGLDPKATGSGPGSDEPALKPSDPSSGVQG